MAIVSPAILTPCPHPSKPSDVRAAITVFVFGDEFLLKHPHAGVSAEDVAGLAITNPNHNAVAINRYAPAKRFTRNWVRMRQGQTGQTAVAHVQRAIAVGVGPAETTRRHREPD